MNQTDQIALQNFSIDAVKWLMSELVAAIPTLLIYTLIFLFVSVVFIVACEKFRVYSRPIWIYSFLTKLHYAVWVPAFLALGFGLGLISALQTSSDRALDLVFRDNITKMVEPVSTLILDISEELPPELADGPLTVEALSEYVISLYTSEAEIEAGNFMEKMAQKLVLHIVALVINEILEFGVSSVGSAVGGDSEKVSQIGKEFSLEMFKGIDFNQEAEKVADEVIGAASKPMANFFTGLRIQLYTNWAGIIQLLAIEPLIYFLLTLLIRYIRTFRKRADEYRGAGGD